MCMHIYVCMYRCVYIYVDMYINCVCVYKCVSMCVHVHVCVHCVHVCGQAHMYKYGGWSLMLGVFLALSLSPFLLRQGLPLALLAHRFS